jgi:steroid delta-isomerase-like uncharacterized protein
MSMGTATPEQVVSSFYDAYARRDIEAMMSHVSDDIVEDLSGIGLVTGAEQEREFLTGVLAAFPDLATEVTRMLACGDVVAAEWRRHGTFSGAPWRGLPASGKPFAFRGGAFLEVHDQKITRITGYYDTAEFARQIGALPAEGSFGERAGLAIFRASVRMRSVLRTNSERQR